MSTFPHSYTDLWHYLQAAQESGRKVVLYGMGNGADKIWAVCDRYGIRIHGVFASDGFVRGQVFHGTVVQTFGGLCDQHDPRDLIVLVAFATSRPEVLEAIAHVASVCELYIPDVPVFGNTLFESNFYRDHKSQFDEARDLLADDTSRLVWDDVICYKLTGDPIPLHRSAETYSDREVMESILPAHTFRTAADLGAYTGDTVRELLEWAPHLDTVVAMEPDRRNFKKLALYAEGETRCTVYPCPLGAWDCAHALTFDSSGNRNANLQATATAKKTETVQVDALDHVLLDLGSQDTPIDYIKFDVEGSEAQALAGCRHTIERWHPALCLSLYHRSEDLFALPLQLHRMAPDYRLYLRRRPGIPAWDLNLYAI